ncbi:MAG: hypothetical protein HYU02_05855 [Thaumarchaeota archaeon]|nr:hypothetical protein [Nitrososphaerota archaeon]
MTDEKPNLPKANIVEELKELHAEFAQISELEQMERSHIENLVDTLKLLLSEVGAAIPVSPEAIGYPIVDVKEAYLLSEAVVVMIGGKENVKSKLLLEFPPLNVLAVIQDCSPKLRRQISERRGALSDRVGLLERIMKELKKTKTVLKPAKQEIGELDVVRSSIASE